MSLFYMWTAAETSGIGQANRPLTDASLLSTSSPKWIVDGWRQGRHYGYPVCCILHFLWDGAIGWPSATVRWHQIDCWNQSDAVPCGVMHSGGSPYPMWRRIRRILRFNIDRLLPTSAARQPRAITIVASRRRRAAEVEIHAWAIEHDALERLYRDESGQDSELNWF